MPVLVSFCWGVSRSGFEVTTHINLVPSSRVCGAIPLLLQMPSGRVPLPLPYEYLFIMNVKFFIITASIVKITVF